ncbi:MAG: hypothetical protein WCA78_11990 [Rhizomicrobium sp.]
MPVLLKFCGERNLYLDKHGARVNVRKGQKVSWEDKYGNFHDLDFVIEKGGSAAKRGKPVAFIEAAWRRYTKHSRNKAQEIQGAVLPIAEKYEHDSPFLGAVLAGIFTKGSLDQLKSVGFHVVYLPYDTIIDAFSAVGIEAKFDEATPDNDFADCVADIEALSAVERAKLKARLLENNKAVFEDFFVALRAKLDRLIERVVVLPLFGDSSTFGSIEDAEKFIAQFNLAKGTGDFHKFEVIVIFSNKDEVRGTFSTKERAQEFLRYLSANPDG